MSAMGLGCVKTQNNCHRIKYINTFAYIGTFFRDWHITIDNKFECFPYNQKLKLVFTQSGSLSVFVNIVVDPYRTFNYRDYLFSDPSSVI